ncbi:MAG: hypothetical protein ABSF18_01210 [Gammaproteobacteria bacterium]|jgi:hypothetical protein
MLPEQKGQALLAIFKQFATDLECYARGVGNENLSLDPLKDNLTLNALVTRISQAHTQYNEKAADEFKYHAEFIYIFLKDRFKAMTESTSPDDEIVAGISLPVLLNNPSTAPEGSIQIYNAAHPNLNMLPGVQQGHYHVMPHLQARIGKFYSDIHPYMQAAVTSSDDELLQTICKWITDNIGDAAAVQTYILETKKVVNAPEVVRRQTQEEILVEINNYNDGNVFFFEGVVAGSVGMFLALITYDNTTMPKNAHDDQPEMIGVGIAGFFAGIAMYAAFVNRNNIASAASNGIRHGWNAIMHRNRQAPRDLEAPLLPIVDRPVY